MPVVRPLCGEVPSAALAVDVWWRIHPIRTSSDSGRPVGIWRFANATRAEQRRSLPRRCRSPADTARTTAFAGDPTSKPYRWAFGVDGQPLWIDTPWAMLFGSVPLSALDALP